jgi:hypothetical protein
MAYEPKTTSGKQSVKAFLNSVENSIRRKDAMRILELMEELTGEEAILWGKDIVGFGSYEYEYSDGSVRSWLRVGFSPRSTALTIYILPGYQDFDDLLEKLGPHKMGRSCLYIRSLEKVDEKILRMIIKKGFRESGRKLVKQSRLKRKRNSMPKFVREAIHAKGLMEKYLVRPDYQRNDYLGWIERAKREETKQKRLNQMLCELEHGNIYMKMKWKK